MTIKRPDPAVLGHAHRAPLPCFSRLIPQKPAIDPMAGIKVQRSALGVISSIPVGSIRVTGRLQIISRKGVAVEPLGCATLSSLMTSVETPHKRRQAERRPGVAGETKPRRQAGRVRPSGTTTRARVASAEAARAKANFDALSNYFRDRSQLRRALGWASPTMRVWEADGPTRPRKQYSERLRQLLVLARAADEWVHDDVHRVGAWMISANDAIDSLIPATIVQELGDDGVERLLSGMH